MAWWEYESQRGPLYQPYDRNVRPPHPPGSGLLAIGIFLGFLALLIVPLVLMVTPVGWGEAWPVLLLVAVCWIAKFMVG